MRTVEAEYLLNSTDVIGNRNLVTLSATASPLPVVTFLTSEAPLSYRSKNGSALRTAQKPIQYRVHQWTPEWICETALEETHRNYHNVEPIGKDEWLLVCGRAADDREHNAFVYDLDGKRTHSFPIGDGIENVMVAREGKEIWVSYFDEGVFSGGYNEPDRLHLMYLYPNAEKSETILPVDTDGDAITVTRGVFARGSRLYLLRENDLFVVDINLHL